MTREFEAQAKAIFDKVLDAGADQRRAALDASCAGEPALRERVEVLLAGVECDDVFLSDPAIQHSAVVPPQELPGAWIGHYRLVRLIGEGGFGSVFLAQQERPVRREVALKIIKLGMDTRAVVARFEQERQSLAVMDHPNIAKVLDAGATATGRPYFVMELVHGRPITEYCDQRRLSIAERLALFAQVCSAVQHAHTKGIIHRDLKPGNILVSSEDVATRLATPAGGADKPSAPHLMAAGPGRVRVIDFGIAKATDRTAADKTALTEHRQFIGTPEYMSPEQAEGSRDLDTRTDVYSLGVLLYELLVGAPPFDPQQLRSAAYAEVQRIIREVDPPKPSTRLSQAHDSLASVAALRAVEPGRLNALVRGELDWIVMRAIEKDRSRRYESPGALAADLSRYLCGEAVLAAPPSRAYVARKFILRNRGPVFATVALGVVLVLGVTGTTIGLLRARGQAIRADNEAAQARKSAAVAESVNTLMRTMISRANRGTEDGRTNVSVREVMDAAAKELESGTASYEPSVASMMAKSIGDTYQALNLYEAAERMMELHVQDEKAIHGPSSLEYAEALSDLGNVFRSRGSIDQASSAFEQARSIATGQGNKGTDLSAAIDVQQSWVLVAKGENDAAEAMLKRAIASYEARSMTTSANYIAGLRNLAATYFHEGNIVEAERYFLKSVEVQRAAGPESASDLQITLTDLAALQYIKRDVVAAEKTAREAVVLARRVFGDEHTITADALDTLSIILSARGDVEGAEKGERESLAIRQRLLAPDHVAIGDSLRILGNTLMDEQKFGDAEAALGAACAIYDKKLAADDMNSVWPHYQLASLMERRGAFAQAEKSLRPFCLSAATGSMFKEGARYEWTRFAVNSLLGSLILDQAVNPLVSNDGRSTRLEEVEALIAPAATELLRLSSKMSPRTRMVVVPAGLERVIRLYQEWDKLEPGKGYAEKAADWKERLEAFKHPAANDSK